MNISIYKSFGLWLTIKINKNDRNYHNISISFIIFTGICLLQYKHYLQEFSLIIFTTRLSYSRIGSFCAPSAGVHHSCGGRTTQRRPLGLFQLGCNVLCSWRTPPEIWCWRWCGHSTQKNGGTDPWEIASLKMKNKNDEDVLARVHARPRDSDFIWTLWR
jgi:hypothetical protein